MVQQLCTLGNAQDNKHITILLNVLLIPMNWKCVRLHPLRPCHPCSPPSPLWLFRERFPYWVPSSVFQKLGEATCWHSALSPTWVGILVQAFFLFFLPFVPDSCKRPGVQDRILGLEGFSLVICPNPLFYNRKPRARVSR